jgi:hypothetical protein
MFLPLTEVPRKGQLKGPGIRTRLFCGVREIASSDGDLPVKPYIHRFLSEKVHMHIEAGPNLNFPLDYA